MAEYCKKTKKMSTFVENHLIKKFCGIIAKGHIIRGVEMKKIITELKKVESLLIEIDKELETLPAGHLKKRTIKKGTFYYHYTSGKEIGITRNVTLIKQLARKKYLLVRKSQLENNLKKPVNKFDATTHHQLIASLPAAYQDLPIHYFYHPTIEKWLVYSHQQNTHAFKQSYYSKGGIKLRSKSEALIANLLETYELPFKYDIVVKFGSQPMSPDFTILHPFTGKSILWEHFGALYEQDYEQRMNDKMVLYMTHGYMPDENLIHTFEFDLKHRSRLEELVKSVLD